MINTTNIVVLKLVLNYIIHIPTLTDDTNLTCYIIEYSFIISCIGDDCLDKRKRNSILHVFTTSLVSLNLLLFTNTMVFD